VRPGFSAAGNGSGKTTTSRILPPADAVGLGVLNRSEAASEHAPDRWGIDRKVATVSAQSGDEAVLRNHVPAQGQSYFELFDIPMYGELTRISHRPG
jgi:hypothetical protein